MWLWFLALKDLRDERKATHEEELKKSLVKTKMREREKVRAAAVAALGTPESMKPRSEAPTPTLPQVWLKKFFLHIFWNFEK